MAADEGALSRAERANALFNAVPWQQIVRAGMAVAEEQVDLLRRANDNLDFVLGTEFEGMGGTFGAADGTAGDDEDLQERQQQRQQQQRQEAQRADAEEEEEGEETDARQLVRALSQVLTNCTTQTDAQLYALVKMEELLCVDRAQQSAMTREVLLARARLFLLPRQQLQQQEDTLTRFDQHMFLRCLHHGDAQTHRPAALCLAHLLTLLGGDFEPFVVWLCDTLSASRSGRSGDALTAAWALASLMRNPAARIVFVQHGGVGTVSAVLSRQASDRRQGQLLYELCFALWAISLNAEHRQEFLPAGAIRTLVELLTVAPSKKVVRMCVATLRNLFEPEENTDNDNLVIEMLSSGIEKVVRNMRYQSLPKEDEEMKDDLEELYEAIMRNHRDLSTFDRYHSEVHSGRLAWGLLHTEKFWKENARKLEREDFALLKVLIELLRSDDDVTVSIALYDIGEFTHFYPNGRSIIRTLGGKDIAMDLIEHDDPEVQKHALQCVSKIMVHNWEFMK